MIHRKPRFFWGMMRKITGAVMALLSTGVFFFCANVCAFGGNEMLQKAAAGVELSALMFQIESGLINLGALSDTEYISLAFKVCALIGTKGKITEAEHYFRNRFSRAPATLDEITAAHHGNGQRAF